MEAPVVEMRDVWKIFEGGVAAVRGCNLTIHKGECLALLGPSGCGKTTTLRMLAGLDTPTRGRIFIQGRDVTFERPQDRNAAMVFQNYALFPHMSVAENVAFGLQMRRLPRDVIARKVREYLALVRLENYADRSPQQLSGGEQQRVALARALITEPAVLLLDEPLGALDRKLREEMQLELKQLLCRLGATVLFVTHDQDEALVMADRIAVMRNGVIEQVGTPAEVYEQPRTPFVAGFVGVSNFFQGEVTDCVEGRARMQVQGLSLHVTGSAPVGSCAIAACRPEKVSLRRVPGTALNSFAGRVTAIKYFGSNRLYYVTLDQGLQVVAMVANLELVGTPFEEGERVYVEIPPEAIRLLQESQALSSLPA
jgi:spermidine/putrescine ABC transporter ATP-binding subunit